MIEKELKMRSKQMYAAIASLIVACVGPMQHALENHMQPVKGSLLAAGACSIPVTLIVLGAYFYAPPEEDTKKTDGVSAVENNSTEQARSRGNSQASGVSTLAESVRDAFKLRGINKRRGASSKAQGDKTRPGETKTVMVAVLSRMVITPMVLLPVMAFLTTYDFHKVFEEWVSFSSSFRCVYTYI